MRVVLAPLAPEVATVIVPRAVFRLKTLLARPDLDQRVVLGEVLIRQQRVGPSTRRRKLRATS
jgi:hypothetical protein